MNKVTIEATKTTYGSIPELSTPTVTVSSSGNAVTYPAVKDITSTFDTYTSTAVEYISYKGTLSVTTSGTKTYYNVTVAGATSKTGSISSPSDDLGIAAMNGQVITITGYFAGFSSTGDKYINILPTAVKADANAKIFNVSPLTLSTAASETSVSFNITSNVDWKASSDNAAFTLDKASGNGDATVTVSFAANTAATSNTAKITVSTEADVTTKSYTVEITQAGLSTEDYSSNVTWTLGTKAYNESATVNGTGSVAILKLGTSSLAGDATLSVPAGKSKIIFYAYAWNGKTCTLTLTMNGSTLTTLSLNPNSGCANTSPYTITSASTDKYSIPLGTVLSAATDITLSTSTATGTRAVLFAIKAE